MNRQRASTAPSRGLSTEPQAKSHSEGMLLALEKIGYGGIILDSTGKVISTNTRAERYLGWTMDLRRREQGKDTTIARGPLPRALQDWVRSCKASAAEDMDFSIAIPRSSRKPLLLRIFSMSEASEASVTNHFVAAVFFDMEACAVPDQTLLSDVFGLTKAEAKIAQMLAPGASLTEISSALDVKVSTVRIHLKAIFWKTGTRRQSELVALLANLAPLKLRD